MNKSHRPVHQFISMLNPIIILGPIAETAPMDQGTAHSVLPPPQRALSSPSATGQCPKP